MTTPLLTAQAAAFFEQGQGDKALPIEEQLLGEPEQLAGHFVDSWLT